MSCAGRMKNHMKDRMKDRMKEAQSISMAQCTRRSKSAKHKQGAVHENNVVHKCPQKVSDNDATRCGGKHVDNGATRCGRSSNAGSSANELHLSTVLVHKNSHTQLTKLIGLCRLPVSFISSLGLVFLFLCYSAQFFLFVCLRLKFSSLPRGARDAPILEAEPYGVLR